MCLGSQSVEVLTNILQYLSLKTVIDLRLVSRFFNHLILVNLPHVKRLDGNMSNPLIIKLLHQRIRNDKNALAKLKRVTSIVNPITSKHDNEKYTPLHLLDYLCEAITFCRGREWIIDHMKNPLDWTDSWDDDETMVLAAWLECLHTVTKLLNKGCDINLRHEYLGSLMYAAAYNDDPSLTDMLIARQMNLPYSEGAYGDPLQLAAYRGSTGVVERLLHADLPLLANAISVGYGPFGSPLGAAAAAGHADMIGTLALSLQSSEIVGPDSKTPLHYAARNGHARAVAELLATDVDVDLVDDDDDTAVDLAAKEGHVGVVNAFLDVLPGWKVNSSMALQYAAWFGHKEIVEVLMDRGLTPPHTYVFDGGLPPAIFCAALRGHHQIVDRMLAYDGTIDFQDPDSSYTLLTRLARCGAVNMLKRVVASGKVDVNALDDYGDWESALHVACRCNRPRVVQALLESPELDPNIENGEGSTALSIALDKELNEIVAMLIADERVGNTISLIHPEPDRVN